MFEDPPSWTTPIANLTQWFDWEALGAIGTVGALWYAVVQGFRSALFERMRAASSLTRVLELIGPVAEFSAHDERGYLDPELSQFMVREGLIDRAIEGLAGISLHDVPDTTATSYLETLRLLLPALRESLTAVGADLSPPHRDEAARGIQEAHDYLSLLRNVYKTGSWQARWGLKRHLAIS